MEFLHSKPKSTSTLWIWSLNVILFIGLVAILTIGYGTSPDKDMATDKTVKNLSSAVTKYDLTYVDFNSRPRNDFEISDKQILTRGNDIYTIYSLDENILFTNNENNISDYGKLKLKIISDILIKKFCGSTICIVRNTYSTSDVVQNIKLGNIRAKALKNWLNLNGNIAPEMISVQSLFERKIGSIKRIRETRQQNRNFSFIVFPKK